MRKSVFISAIFFMGLGALGAQTTVTGRVVDAEGKPLSFASLKFSKINDTSKSITEKITDENGNFQILFAENGTYNVVTSYKNLAPFSQQYDFATSEVAVTITLPKEKVTDIKEVVLNKKAKSSIVRKIDRIVMNVSENPIAAGKSSLELFKLAPGVFVNNGKISINGVWGTRVMVDGKMLNLAGADLKSYLQNLRSNEIQSIEVIAHPPAEFDAEGSGGIINIILKKNTKEGINGYIGNDYSIGMGKYPTYNPYAAINYKKGKLGLSASYSYNNSKSYEELQQKRNFPNGGNYDQSTTDVQKNKSNRVKIGSTYDISEKQSIGLQYTGQFSNFSSSSVSDSYITYPDATKNLRSVGSFPTESKTTFHNAGLNYNIKTDSLGSKFSLVADYTYNKRNGSSLSDSRDLNAQNIIVRDTLFRFSYPSTAKIFTADAKYSWNFKSKANLSFGAKVTSTDIDNENRYDVFQNTWYSIPDHDFNFSYRERIYAAFASFTGAWKKIEYKLGLRGEQSDVKGILSGSQAAEVSQNYFSWFPSVFLKRNLDEEGNNYLALSYNRRIKRPSYFDLNPYKYYIDNYSVTTGNPYLKPQFTNSYEISGMWGGKYYTAISYNYTTDIIAQIIENYPGQELVTIIKANAGTNKVLTATLSAPVTIAKWWTTNNNLLLTYTVSKSPYFLIEKPSFILQTEHEISLGKGYTFTLNGFYTPQMVTGNVVTKGIASVDVGVQKKFFKNKLTARASVSDIFYTNNYKATSYFNDTRIWINHKEQSRVFSISLIYSFKTGENFKAKKIESSNTDEKGRL
ncbi:outer membrane beta-barrel family protein [Chryseobacterium sp.]|uniref:outer membrane beta-barrel family protein n=1 Tax=Chryseobacterium sp. TaxID=1871047 RepID=UPI0025BF5D09|nr:outer membrane beta-barrel family protein [Chryseobacterium sp.]MBV8327454.1 TonB-dependent receptor [Chryseobacterium sp.]